MNKRGFLATLAAMCVAPFAVKADPVAARRKKALALSNMPRTEIIWSDEPPPPRELPASWEPPPHEHDAYFEIRIGAWRQAVRVCGSEDPVESVKCMLKPDTLLTDAIEQELTYPDSVLHTIRAESKAAVYKYLAERSACIIGLD